MISLLVLSVLAATPVAAQEAVAESREENGFKVGDGRLHLRATGDLHYITNPGRLPTTSGDAGKGDMALMAGPGLELQVPGENVAFDLSGDLVYRGYLNIGGLNSGSFSSFAANGDARLKINEQGSFSVNIFDSVTRSSDPGNQVTGRTINHTYNTAGLSADWKPGGGALLFGIGYSFFFDLYDKDADNAVSNPADLDNFRHRPRLKAEWKFLPKTQIYLDGGAQFTSYTTSANPANTDVDASLGARGYITTRLSARLEAGWGGSFGLETRHDVVGEAELGYDFSEVTKLKIGYSRGIAPVSFFGTVVNDRVFARFESHLGNVARLNLGARYNNAKFGGAGGQDNTIDAGVGLDFQVLSWLMLSVGDDFGFQTSARTTGVNQGYLRNDAYIRVTGRY